VHAGYTRREEPLPKGTVDVTISSAILFVLGILGATDIALFHMWAHRLRQHAPSRAELITHFLRGPTYCLLFFAIPSLALDGLWFVALLLLLLFDLGISVADFWLEPDSRRDLGGLPRGEYLLHVVMAMLFGALVASILYQEGHRMQAATALSWRGDDVPSMLRVALTVMSPLVLLTGLLDLRAVFRLGRTRAS